MKEAVPHQVDRLSSLREQLGKREGLTLTRAISRLSLLQGLIFCYINLRDRASKAPSSDTNHIAHYSLPITPRSNMYTLLPFGNNNHTSTTSSSTNESSMSISSSRAASPGIVYIEPGPHNGPMFGIAEPIKPNNVTQKEDGEVSDKNSHHLSDSLPFLTPKKTQIKVEPVEEKFQCLTEKHNAREVEGKQDAAIQASDTTPDISTASPHVRHIADVSQELLLLYCSLHAIYSPQQNQEQNPPDAWEFPSEDDWDWEVNSNTDNNASDPPLQGDSMHPPSQWVCGEHLGMGWELNDPLTKSYYRVLIPDPTTNRLIVAPFISYSIQSTKAEVQATYGKDYPIHNRILQPIPVDYIRSPPTQEQLSIFDRDSPFADAVNRIINEQMPLHLSAAIRRYQHYKDAQYGHQQRIRDLQDQEQRHLERAMCILSELENANVLGRLIAHGDEILHSLTSDQSATSRFCCIMHYFEGTITQSVIDATPNPLCASYISSERYHAEACTEYVPLTQHTHMCSKECNHLEVEDNERRRLQNQQANDIFCNAVDEIEDRLRDQLRHRKDRRPYIVHHIPAGKPKRCFRCRLKGHIRLNCPNKGRSGHKS